MLNRRPPPQTHTHMHPNSQAGGDAYCSSNSTGGHTECPSDQICRRKWGWPKWALQGTPWTGVVAAFLGLSLSQGDYKSSDCKSCTSHRLTLISGGAKMKRYNGAIKALTHPVWGQTSKPARAAQCGRDSRAGQQRR